MKNRKGQALIEFVIILPVFILLIFAFIDFGKIIYVKNELSNIIPNIKEMYEKGKSNQEITTLVEKNNKENQLLINNTNNLVTFEIYRYIELITPGMGIVLDNPYKVSASIVIDYE